MSTLEDQLGGPRNVIGGPFGSKLTQRDYASEGIPVIRGSNMDGTGRWIGGQFAYVSKEKLESDLRSNIAEPGDIIVTQRGTLGQVAIVPDSDGYDRYVISQSQMAIRVPPERADRDFVYYFLRSPGFATYVESTTIQTGVPHINLGILRNTPAAWPDRELQTQISLILAALDDKIDLNRRMNKTLEAMARAIFKDWFTDFGPTRAKVEGRAPYLAPEIWALFPDQLDGDGKPVGWCRAKLSQVAEIVSGGTPSKARPELWDGSVPWVSPKSMKGIHVRDSDERVSQEAIGQGTRDCDPGSVLVMVRGMGLHQGVRISQARCRVTFNQDVKALIPRSIHGAHLLFAMLDADAYLFSKVEASGHGTGVIPTRVLEDMELTRPPGKVHKECIKLIDPLNERIAGNDAENLTLAATRDLLLPKLMSGEIRVKDAERIAEAAA